MITCSEKHGWEVVMTAEISALQKYLDRFQHAAIKQRLLAVIMKLEGLSNNRIAQEIGYSEAWVKKWINRYKKAGVSGLFGAQKTGRPPLLDSDVVSRLKFHLKAIYPDKISGKDILQVLEQDFNIACTLDYAYKLKTKLKV